MNKKIGAIIVVAVLLVCAVGIALIYTSGSESSKTNTDFTSAELQDMT
jgi:flagellar basal body-associated protein FliL